MQDSIKVKGLLQIYNARTGELLYEKENLVVNSGLALAVDNLKTPTATLTHIAVGTGINAVQPTDTALQTELLRKPIDDIDTINNTLTAETLFQDLEALGVWRELGLFTASIGGIMFNRINILFTKTSEDAVLVKFTIVFST